MATEPLTWLLRKRVPGAAWSEWIVCARADFDAIRAKPLNWGMEYEAVAVVALADGVTAAPAPNTREVMQMALAALEVAHAGLKWYRDRCTGEVNGSDDEADEQIGAAMGALVGALGVRGSDPDAELLRLLAVCETTYYTATRALDVPGIDVERCKAHHAQARADLLAHIAGVGADRHETFSQHTPTDPAKAKP